MAPGCIVIVESDTARCSDGGACKRRYYTSRAGRPIGWRAFTCFTHRPGEARDPGGRLEKTLGGWALLSPVASAIDLCVRGKKRTGSAASVPPRTCVHIPSPPSPSLYPKALVGTGRTVSCPVAPQRNARQSCAGKRRGRENKRVGTFRAPVGRHQAERKGTASQSRLRQSVSTAFAPTRHCTTSEGRSALPRWRGAKRHASSRFW